VNSPTLSKIIHYARKLGYYGLYLGLGLGVLYSFGGLIIDAMVSLKYLDADDMDTTGLGYGTLLSFGALIGMPVIFGVVGALIGAIIGAIRLIITKI